MSTKLMNEVGDAVALRFFGGRERGTLVDVAMPNSVAGMVSAMTVREEFAGETTTLGAWIEEMRQAGHTVRFGQPAP